MTLNIVQFGLYLILVPLLVSVIANLVTPKVKDWLGAKSEYRRQKRIKQLERQLEEVTEHKKDLTLLFCYVADWTLTVLMGFFFGLCVYLYPHNEHTSYLAVELQQAAGIGFMAFPFTSGLWMPLVMIRRVRFYDTYKSNMEARIATLQGFPPIKA